VFRRGDTGGDGLLSITDAIATLEYLFLAGETPVCLSAADTNDDGGIDIADALFLLLHLFTGSAAPPAPGEGCGPDPTPDELLCTTPAGCL
jgi:hypothetical protein